MSEQETQQHATTPRISVVIPTLNSGRTLRSCLQSIRNQTFAQRDLEIVLADAGSKDQTLAIAREFHVDTVVPNPRKTGEAGKSAGIAAAKGEFIALIDSDNILDAEDWIHRLLAPFEDAEIVAAEPLSFTRRDRDPALTRYFAMAGVNDPISLFIGDYDRTSLLTGRWTELPLRTEDRGSYLKVWLEPACSPTIGANGFVMRRSLLDSIRWQPYLYDSDIAQQMIASGHPVMAKVKVGITHLYCSRLSDFAAKQDRRIRDFFYFSAYEERRYQWNARRRRGVFRFALVTVLLVPLLFHIVKGLRRKADMAWLYHIPVCWLTLCIYGWATLLQLIGLRLAEKTRSTWQNPS